MASALGLFCRTLRQLSLHIDKGVYIRGLQGASTVITEFVRACEGFLVEGREEETDARYLVGIPLIRTLEPR